MHRLRRMRAGLPRHGDLPRRQRAGAVGQLHPDELRALRSDEIAAIHFPLEGRDLWCCGLSFFEGFSMADTNIESLLKEQRVFKPGAMFASCAHIPSLDAYDEICARAA